MEIRIVQVKQVPDTGAVIRIAADGVSVKSDDVKLVINPYDEFAVEEALRIREKVGGRVTVVSFGGPKTIEAVRSALAMGAEPWGTDPGHRRFGNRGLATAKILAVAIRPAPFDLILAGQRAVDDDGWLVGPAVAEYLNIPHIPLVVKTAVEDGRITCHHTTETGIVVTRTPLPALLTTQRGLTPRVTPP